MAIYHASTKPIARSAGRSAVAAAAYRAGTELVDARTGLVHDYTRKGGVERTEILTPDGLGCERNALWNAAELAEKRKDARTAREWIVALPSELDAEQRAALARDFAQALVTWYGVVADLAIHAPDREGDHRNHHAHILTTTRQVSRGPDGALMLGDKALIELSDKALRERGLRCAADEVQAVRELWERTANAALERAGVAARIDARSLQAQGMDREATQHLGPAASEMERRGKASDRGDGNRTVLANNTERVRLAAEIIDLQAERARIEAEREARRRKLVELEESLRNDADARIDLRQAYPAAGFHLGEREGRRVWIYPHGDLGTERKAVFEARQAWNGRKQARQERERMEAEREARVEAQRREAILERARVRQGYRMDSWEIRERWSFRQQEREREREADRLLEEHERQEQEEHALDDLVAAETAPGVRHPQRSRWREWRAQTLSRKYDPVYSAEMAERDIYCRWMPEHGGLYLRLGKQEVIDQGPLLLAKNGEMDIPLLIATAQGKGWNTLEFTGSPDFQEKAAVTALQAGLAVADADLAERAQALIEERREQERIEAAKRAGIPDSVGLARKVSSEVGRGLCDLIEAHKTLEATADALAGLGLNSKAIAVGVTYLVNERYRGHTKEMQHLTNEAADQIGREAVLRHQQKQRPDVPFAGPEPTVKVKKRPGQNKGHGLGD
ncbi:MAG: MobA/MobL family protein [Acidithiobacillus sp.]|nr:MobA/MobL family protein [Acidithiobacillus sp.]